MLLKFWPNLILFDGDGGGGGGADKPPKDPPKTPDPVPYDRFKDVNNARKKAENELAELKAKKQEAEDERLTEEKKWQELAEKRQTELDELKGKLSESELNATRLKVAAKHELPPELADRLQGDDEAAMEKDAEQLATLVKKRSPGVPPKGTGGPIKTRDIRAKTPEEIRKAIKDGIKLEVPD